MRLLIRSSARTGTAATPGLSFRRHGLAARALFVRREKRSFL